ncbi:MAG: hypothetical protein IH623_28240 [Verrucomicrobia bacterium]|nr:hypothetical protein [Verrucomicrobiota bacterium]
MPIFINWFETDISAPVQQLLNRDFASWAESEEAHKSINLRRERFCRFDIRSGDKEIVRTTVIAANGEALEGFEKRDVDLTKERRIAERVIEFNLGQHLASRGMHVQFGSFVASATRPAFRIADIGLSVESGISFKSYFLHYKRQHGITLDWRVRQFFDQPISALPDTANTILCGLPVLLRADVPEPPAGTEAFRGRYLGIITELGANDAVVLCRDAQKRQISKTFLTPEAKPDVVAALSSISREQRGSDSIQRRIMTLSHSLTQSGRRNIKILQDKLRSAIDFLSSDNRPFITVDFTPDCVGRMRISTAPAVAQTQQEKYV